MSWHLTRRSLVTSPLLYRLLQGGPDVTPGGSPEATPADSPTQMPGVDDGHYVSPTYKWEVWFDTEKWEPIESTSDNGIDRFTLHGLEGGAPTCTVVFGTSPIGTGDPESGPLERKMLDARKALNSDFDNALITVGEDAEARAIYRLFQTEETEEGNDDHWIASYVARHPGNEDLDKIVELDSIGIPDTEGGLVIKATSEPKDYDVNAYELVEELRHSFYDASSGQTAGSTSTFSLLAVRASGGTRPKVQY